MPIVTVTTMTLVAIGAQIGSSYFNYKRTKKMQEHMQQMVHEMETKLHEENAAFTRKEMIRLLQASNEMEEEMLKSRLEAAALGINTELELSAYASSLENWPLMVPPYVMKDNSLLLGDQLSTSRAKLPVHCIIAPSMDTMFDRKVLPALEDTVASFIKCHFNTATDHPVIFYQNAWKNDLSDASALIKDLHAHTSGLPVLVISPRFNSEGKLYFLFSFWGTGSSEEGHSSEFFNARFMPNGITRPFEPMHDYCKEDVEAIIGEIAPAMQAFIGYIADSYFWSFDKIAPMMPSLLDSGALSLPAEMRQECELGYKKTYDDFMTQETNILLHPDTALSLISATQYGNTSEMAVGLWKRMAALRGFENDFLNPDLYTFSDNDRLFLQNVKQMHTSIATQKQIDLLLKKIEVDSLINNIPVDDIYY